MFGSGKARELEARLNDVQGRLDSMIQENGRLNQELDSARGRIAELEAQLNDFDLTRLKEEARASRAEYEGLKELYARKNKEFDDTVEEEEQKFARDAALQRFNLDNEIRNNRQANRDYVTSTVKTFGESYNYYLNQIRLLMDALGDVATRTGEALFSGENDDLKARIGQQMREKLRSGADALKNGNGDVILIDTNEEEVPEEPVFATEEPPAEEIPEEPVEAPAEDTSEEPVEVPEEVPEDEPIAEA